MPKNKMSIQHSFFELTEGVLKLYEKEGGVILFPRKFWKRQETVKWSWDLKSPVWGKKNENWGMFATPHSHPQDIISQLHLTITCRFKMFVHPLEVYFGHECGHCVTAKTTLGGIPVSSHSKNVCRMDIVFCGRK